MVMTVVLNTKLLFWLTSGSLVSLCRSLWLTVWLTCEPWVIHHVTSDGYGYSFCRVPPPWLRPLDARPLDLVKVVTQSRRGLIT